MRSETIVGGEDVAGPASPRLSLTERVSGGVLWKGIGQAGRHVVQLIVVAVLARLLSPHEFGLMAMVWIFIALLGLFEDLGLGAGLVWKQGLTTEQLSSTFWLNVASGVLLMVLAAATAPLAAWFFGEQALVPIIGIVSVCFLVDAFGIVQGALLVKVLAFKRSALIQTAAVVVSGIVAIALALSGAGVYSLAFQELAYSTVTVALLWAAADWRPRLEFRVGAIRDIWRFGCGVVGFNLVNYFNRNLDKLIIGKLLGPAALGLYGLAYGLMLFPVQKVTGMLVGALFPALSQIQADLPRVRRAYCRAIRLTSAITFPLMTGLLVTAPELIPVLYGGKWLEAVVLVQMLCVAGFLQSTGTTVGILYRSQGRTDLQLRVALCFTPIRCLAFLLGARWGITGVAVACTVASVMLWYPAHYIPNRLIGLSTRGFLRSLAPTAASSAIMLTALWLLKRSVFLHLPLSNLVLLVIEVAVGTVVYLGSLQFSRSGVLAELVEVARSGLTRGASAVTGRQPVFNA